MAGLVWTMAGCSAASAAASAASAAAAAQKGAIAGAGLLLGHEAGFVDGPAFRSRFRHPAGLAIDSHGRVFVADRDNHAIRLVTPNGFVHTLCGDGSPGLQNGPGLSSRFYGPAGLALDPTGSLFVADSNNHVLRKIHFVTLPLTQREVGNTAAVLVRQWYEWQAAQELARKQDAVHALKLERQMFELRKELADSKKATAAEFAKMRSEQMQMQRQFICYECDERDLFV